MKLTEMDEAQLEQLWTVTHNTYLMSKDSRDKLVTEGLARHVDGWNLLTEEGTRMVYKLRIERRKRMRKEA